MNRSPEAPDSNVPFFRGLKYWADQLELSQRTLRRAIAAGELTHARIGSRILISPESVSSWITNKSHGGRAA